MRTPTIWLTGIPASGKSTLARGVRDVLKMQAIPADVLDGDDLRRTVSGGLGFSKADRGENVRRVTGVAEILARNGIVPIVALVSPYALDRMRARTALLPFVEVHVRCPFSVCVSRDPKGLYKRAMAGEISGITGVDDPYEPPSEPEVVVNTDCEKVETCVERIVKAALRAFNP